MDPSPHFRADRSQARHPSFLTSEDVLLNFGLSLTPYERCEIRQHPVVYYFAPHVKKIHASQEPLNNFGYDNSSGRYRCIRNDHLHYRYQIIGELGQGTFGDVAEAFDHKTQRRVAIKIARNSPSVTQQAQLEVKMLEYLKRKGADSSVVVVLDHFQFRNHACVVFEVLEGDLFRLLKSQGFSGLELPRLRHITRGVLDSLRCLASLCVVHCDIKPENIVFHNQGQSLKLIDFGSSCFALKPFDGDVQTIFYRAPEVILAAGATTAIDMWSLGCVVVEMLTGKPMFAGGTVEEQLRLFIEALGCPPPTLLAAGKRSRIYFTAEGHLRTACVPGSTPLASKFGDVDSDLLSFLQGCFEWNPSARLTPAQALQHPFISNQPSKDPVSSVILSSLRISNTPVSSSSCQEPPTPMSGPTLSPVVPKCAAPLTGDTLATGSAKPVSSTTFTASMKLSKIPSSQDFLDIDSISNTPKATTTMLTSAAKCANQLGETDPTPPLNITPQSATPLVRKSGARSPRRLISAKDAPAQQKSTYV